MTENEFAEAKKLVAELGSIRKAAMHVGKPYATFRRQFLRHSQEKPLAIEPATTPMQTPAAPPILDGINWSDLHRMQREAERQRTIDNYLHKPAQHD
jgi:hypothetical protein